MTTLPENRSPGAVGKRPLGQGCVPLRATSSIGDSWNRPSRRQESRGGPLKSLIPTPFLRQRPGHGPEPNPHLIGNLP